MQFFSSYFSENFFSTFVFFIDYIYLQVFLKIKLIKYFYSICFHIQGLLFSFLLIKQNNLSRELLKNAVNSIHSFFIGVKTPTIIGVKRITNNYWFSHQQLLV